MQIVSRTRRHGRGRTDAGARTLVQLALTESQAGCAASLMKVPRTPPVEARYSLIGLPLIADSFAAITSRWVSIASA